MRKRLVTVAALAVVIGAAVYSVFAWYVVRWHGATSGLARAEALGVKTPRDCRRGAFQLEAFELRRRA